jgi:BASS family bile acid:Na+ symporter
VNVSFFSILITLLLSQIAPLAFGLAIHHWATGLAQRIVKSVRAIANILLVALIAMILFDQYETLSAIRGRAWLGMTALSLASLAIGWVCGGSLASRKKSMALTTATRNVAVGLVIAVGSLSGTPAVTAVVAYGLFSTLIALVCSFLLRKLANRNDLPQRPCSVSCLGCGGRDAPLSRQVLRR